MLDKGELKFSAYFQDVDKESYSFYIAHYSGGKQGWSQQCGGNRDAMTLECR